jgi:hypothetical protein
MGGTLLLPPPYFENFLTSILGTKNLSRKISESQRFREMEGELKLGERG